MSRHAARRTLLALAAGLCVLQPAQAQGTEFPSKPITIINEWAVGGGTDITTRALAKEMHQKILAKMTERYGENFWL